MWTYRQETGEMVDAGGKVVGVGYAGHAAGFNNHSMQGIKGVGPLPVGLYTIGKTEAEHSHLGTNVAFLTPHKNNEMFGRSEFFLHGRKGPGDIGASNGCIVQDHGPRMIVLNSPDKDLQVVP